MGWLIIIGVGIACCAVGFGWGAFHRWSKWSRRLLLVFILSGYLSYSVYTAIYPLDSFYEYEFERISHQDFPRQGQFLFKWANYPDIHGDYTSCALFTAPVSEMESLFAEVPLSEKSVELRVSGDCLAGFETSYGQELELFKFVSAVDPSKGRYSEWGLLNDRETAFFHYSSW